MSAHKDSGKKHRLQCTGLALETVSQHTSEQDITLFGSCFCPFVQRSWIAFEHLGIPYQVRTLLSATLLPILTTAPRSTVTQPFTFLTVTSIGVIYVLQLRRS